MPRPRRQAPPRPEALPDTDPVEPDEFGPADDQRPSKSALKREVRHLQRLGDALVALRPDRLAELPIEEPLREAIELARRIRARGGLRRQRQLIGKLMRDADGDAIRAALDDEGREHRTDVAVQHAAERWRERMLADDRVLANWLAEFPDTRESVESLIVRARSELAAGGPSRAFRDLYRRLRDRLEAAAHDRQADQSDAR